jgi:hypothetical protein
MDDGAALGRFEGALTPGTNLQVGPGLPPSRGRFPFFSAPLRALHLTRDASKPRLDPALRALTACSTHVSVALTHKKRAADVADDEEKRFRYQIIGPDEVEP